MCLGEHFTLAIRSSILLVRFIYPVMCSYILFIFSFPVLVCEYIILYLLVFLPMCIRDVSGQRCIVVVSVSLCSPVSGEEPCWQQMQQRSCSKGKEMLLRRET